MDRISDLGISALFRCDGCGAQAFAAATRDNSLLLFCGHHSKKHLAALERDGWDLHDRTHLINETPSISANAT